MIAPMRRVRSPTLKDVAAAAGVTPMAVSVALNGSSSRARVSEATRERIRAIAERLGYQANAVARSLHRRRTEVIGLWSGRTSFNADAPFSAVVLHGLQIGCAEHGRDLLLRGALAEGTRDDVAYRELADGRIDGAVIDVEPGDARLPALIRAGLALVGMVDPLPGVPCVLCDDAEAGRLLCAHLRERGHRRVLWRGRSVSVGSQDARYEAFVAEGRRCGVEVARVAFRYAEPGLTSAERALLDPSRTGRCTAIVGFADHAVQRVLDDLDALGWAVPGDVAVAGFDGLRLFLDATPRHRLTTVAMPWQEVARQAVGLLARIIDGEDVPERTILPVELLPGDTT